MDWDGWRASIHRVAKSWTRLKWLSTCTRTVFSTEHVPHKNFTQSMYRAYNFISICHLAYNTALCLCLWVPGVSRMLSLFGVLLRISSAWIPGEILRTWPQKGSLSLGLRKPLCSQWKVEWFPLSLNISVWAMDVSSFCQLTTIMSRSDMKKVPSPFLAGVVETVITVHSPYDWLLKEKKVCVSFFFNNGKDMLDFIYYLPTASANKVLIQGWDL